MLQVFVRAGHASPLFLRVIHSPSRPTPAFIAKPARVARVGRSP
jgi:hypothetical protein